MTSTEPVPTDEDRDTTSAGHSPMLWVVGILAAVAIVALIFGYTSSRERYLFARRTPEPKISHEEAVALPYVATAIEQAANEARGQLAAQADQVRKDLDDLGTQLHETAQTRGHTAAAHLDTATAWLDKTISDVEDAGKKVSSSAVQRALDRLHNRLTKAQDRLVRASSTLNQSG